MTVSPKLIGKVWLNHLPIIRLNIIFTKIYHMTFIVVKRFLQLFGLFLAIVHKVIKPIIAKMLPIVYIEIKDAYHNLRMS